MFICSKCYCDIFVRRKLDAKTAQHQYFTKIAFEGHKSEKAAAVLEEEKLHETKIVEETETVDSKSDTYARVGFWRDEVCYKQLIIQRPFFFTKQI
jgi:hypothetical protein